MTSISAPGTSFPKAGVSPEAISKARVVLILSITAFLALFAYYLIGVDEGMVSLFGAKTMNIHEWVHDSRLFLGFPCH